MAEQHFCPKLKNQNKDDNQTTFSIKYNSSADVWVISYKDFADQEMVEMGEAESLGELTMEVTFPIEYCPFCGQRLN